MCAMQSPQISLTGNDAPQEKVLNCAEDAQNEVDTRVELWGKTIKNPLFAASGCFNFGKEAADFQDLSGWGGIISKGLTRLPRLGNPSPRMCETASGMLNSVGLQNPGVDVFLEEDLPFMQAQGCAVVVNVAAAETEDYVAVCERLDAEDIFAIELNFSCPNVEHGCMSFGADARLLFAAMDKIRQATHHRLIAKLTPNVTSITEMARACEIAGADAVSLVNTFLGMAVDLRSRRPVLRNNTGGLSGPAIKPIALRMVAETAQAVNIPVIGLGGIGSGRDVLEFLLAGASAVEIGTANFIHLDARQRIEREMCELSASYGVSRIADWIGQLRYWS